MKAKIEVELEDFVSYEIEYETGIERAYDTKINSLIYDEEGRVIASDDYVERITSESFQPNGEEERLNGGKSNKTLIKGYVGTINRMLKHIKENNGDINSFIKDMYYLSRKDVEYNKDLWYQYKPLYDLLVRKGYELEVEVA